MRIKAAKLLLNRVCRQRGIHHDGGLGECLAISCVFHHIGSKRIRKLPRRSLNGNKLPIKNVTQSVIGDQRQVFGRFKKSIHGGGQGSTTAVPKYYDKSEASSQMFDRVPQTAKHVVPQTIAGDADNKQVIRPFIEDQFDRYPRIGTAQYRGEWQLTWRTPSVCLDTKIACIDLDNTAYCAGIVGQARQQCSEPLIALAQTHARGFRIRRSRSRRSAGHSVPIGYFYGLHGSAVID